ncbi:MAG: PAS domain S-box protein [Trueperaceae bacterium]
MGTERQGGSQRELMEEDALFRVVAHSAHDSIVTINSESTILFANPATEEMFGYNQDELLGQSLIKLMPEYLRHLHEAAVERYLETGERHVHWGGVQLPGLHASGNEIPLEVSFGETVLTGERIFTGVIRNISERKRAERRWEAQYSIARILATAEDLDDAAFRILQTISKCLDWQVGVFWVPDNQDDLLHATISWNDPTLDAEPFLAATRDSIFATGVGVPGRVRETGEPLWISNVEYDANFPRRQLAREIGLGAGFAFAIVDGDNFIGVMEFYSQEIREPDETLLNLMKSTAVQIGQFVRRRQAEEALRQLNSELEKRVLERTAQLEESTGELESFVYSVSHDLRSPLRGIDGFSHLLLEDHAMEISDTATDYLLRITAATRRMGELIDALLNLSRISKSDLKKQTVNLSEIALEVTELLEQRQPEREVEVKVTPGLQAEGDRQLLRIVLENLLENSWKFTAGQERPRIEFGTITAANRQAFFVRDNGAGFDMRYAERLFTAFQRLHSPEQFEGTGIGLTTVQRIIQRHGGAIWAEAEVGAGATLYFTL